MRHAHGLDDGQHRDELRLGSIMTQNPGWVFKRAVAFVRSRGILAR
jgi:hypothetical protein